MVLSHLVLNAPALLPRWAARGAIQLGPLGVRVFFVISGYLITTLLLEDVERHGRVRLGRFYVRRALRIFPPYYAYLSVLTLCTVAGVLPSVGRWWPAWLYASNAVRTDNWNTLHSWSLAVEEQFYLTWPLVLSRVGRRRGARVALDVCLAMPTLRGFVAVVTRDAWIASDVSFDFLAAGCLLALHPEWVGRVLDWFAARGRIVALLAALVVVCEGVVASAGTLTPKIQLLVLQTAEVPICAIAVAWCVSHAGSGVGRVLNARPLVVIGIGSYSVYLWQQLFTGRGGLVTSVPAVLLATAASGAASYFMVERPSLALRRRIERWWARPRHAIGAVTADVPSP